MYAQSDKIEGAAFMNNSEIAAMIRSIRNNYVGLGEVAGPVILVEFYMRLLAQLSKPLQKKIKELQQEKASRNIKEYWECNLEFIDRAIDHVFGEELGSDDRKKLKRFRKLRNKMVHADFVGLMSELNIRPTDREIIKSGERNIVHQSDMMEAIKRIENNNGFSKFRLATDEIIEIFNTKLFYLVVNK